MSLGSVVSSAENPVGPVSRLIVGQSSPPPSAIAEIREGEVRLIAMSQWVGAQGWDRIRSRTELTRRVSSPDTKKPLLTW
jgi:hypothetical protein